jgi:hypothetical protein
VLSKLMAAVRPEFRADVLVIDPHDPVFGGPPCRVSACERAARLHDLCEGHYQRWERHQRPEITEFAESTAATMRSHQVLQPCRAPACGNARNSNGLCIGHIRAWRRSGYAQIGTWLETLPFVDHSAPHGICRVGSCTLWATVKVPLCATHASRWRRYGRPGIDEFVATYADISLTRDCITLGQLAPQLRLEVQYVLQQRCDQRQAPIQPALVQRVVYTLARSGMASLLQLTDDLWHERIVTGPTWTERYGRF